MKQILSILVSSVFLLFGSTAMAADTNASATISGTLQNAGGTAVTLLLVPRSADMTNVPEDAAVLRQDAVVNSDGSYCFNASFSGFTYGKDQTVSNYAVCVKQGATDVTASVQRATARVNFTPVAVSVEPKMSGAQIKAQAKEFFQSDALQYNLLFVGYDAQNKLTGCINQPAAADASANYNIWKQLGGPKQIRVFLYGDTDVRIPTTKELADKKVISYNIQFPGYTKKAATFSIDDGNYARDLAIINMMHRYNIRATFNLCDVKNDGNYDIYVHPDFEIANHTTHIRMNITENYTEPDGRITTPSTYEDCIDSISSMARSLSGTLNANPKGLIWPFITPREREFYPELVKWAAENGYEYCRDSRTNDRFDVPADWMDWTQTVWTNAGWVEKIKGLAVRIAEMEEPEKFQILSVAGHGNDMEEGVAMDLYETVFQTINSANIWKATNLELVRYEKATHQLEITDTQIYNPTDVTIYLYMNGQKCIAKPNSNAIPA